MKEEKPVPVERWACESCAWFRASGTTGRCHYLDPARAVGKHFPVIATPANDFCSRWEDRQSTVRYVYPPRCGVAK